MGIPKSDLLGVTVDHIHVAGQRFLAVRYTLKNPYSCEMRVLYISYGKKRLIPPRTSLKLFMNAPSQKGWIVTMFVSYNPGARGALAIFFPPQYFSFS